MYKKLSKVVEIDEDKCVSCYKCISVCPAKYCNNATEDSVVINEDLCIGCGQCIEHCDHDARIIIDDFETAMKDLKKNEKIIAICAPSVVANIADYRRFNGWLKSLGVDAVFDVSFGAELTVKTYVEHIKKNKPKLVISQPCPALVTYIQIYHPELLPHLAPADSPMMHTMKMVKEFYPKYKKHKIMIVSPCIAKKREFDEVALGDYNVTMKKIIEYIESKNINLNNYPKVDFDNDPAERAVLFSSPGGLLKTAMRDVPGIENMSRKIEGPEVIYDYLSDLHANYKKGFAPLLIDCLNCFMGCNGGPGTPRNKSLDEVEYLVEQRKKEAQKDYDIKTEDDKKGVKKVQKTINKYWKKGLYNRKYLNLSDNYQNLIKVPDKTEIENIYQDMKKVEESDIKNCTNCGYHLCEKMAVAIYNNLNIKENCHVYLTKIVREEKDHNEKTYLELKESVSGISDSINVIVNNISTLVEEITRQYAIINQLVEAMKEMDDSIKDVEGIAKTKEKDVDNLVEIAKSSSNKLQKSNEVIHNISKRTSDIFKMINLINDVNDKTNVLAINAAIESARAGQAGKRFSIIAGEIRRLASSTLISTENISNSLSTTVNMLDGFLNESTENYQKFLSIIKYVETLKSSYMEIISDVKTLIDNSGGVINNISELSTIAAKVRDNSKNIHVNADNIKKILNQMLDN